MKSFDFWGLEAVISFSVYSLSKTSRNHAEMNRKLVACNFSQLRFFVAASGHASLEKFDSDVPDLSGF